MLADDAVRDVDVLTAEALTSIATIPDAEELKVPAPAYLAVMLLVPIGSAEVVKLALPADKTADPTKADPL